MTGDDMPPVSGPVLDADALDTYLHAYRRFQARLAHLEDLNSLRRRSPARWWTRRRLAQLRRHWEQRHLLEVYTRWHLTHALTHDPQAPQEPQEPTP